MNDPDPVVQQRTQPPPGNIPRGRQMWVMITVAVVIVSAVVFSGSTNPTPENRPHAPAPVNATTKAEVDRYAAALRQEEARLKLAQEQRNRMAPNPDPMHAPVQGGGIPGQAVIGPNGQPYYPVAGNPPAEPVDPIKQDRQKREYVSLFASNVALSYRKEEPKPSPPAPPPPLLRRHRMAMSPLRQPSWSKERNHCTPTLASAPPPPGTHMLFEGTILEAVLTNRIDGSFAGPVNCQVTTDVYSHNQQDLLIPKGSRVLGEARRVSERDQERLAVLFHRLIMPDGYSINLDQMPGLDQAGASALKDKVDHHYLSTFGTSVALGLLAGFSMYGTGGVFTGDATDLYRQGVANQLGRDSSRILDRQINRLPDIQIREGHRVKILLSKDISLPAYKSHPVSVL